MRDKKVHAEHERCRKIAKATWVAAFGPIPRDEKGHSYQIHHKDRNWRNNSLDNLQCVSRREHDAIHRPERIQRGKELAYKFSAENGRQYGKLNAGKVRSAEARAKIAAARRGKPMSDETKRKIALSSLGKNTGKKKSPEEVFRREHAKAVKRATDPEYGRALVPCCGESHPRARLNTADITEIRRLYALGGVTHNELAQQFSITSPTVTKIIRRKAWARVP